PDNLTYKTIWIKKQYSRGPLVMIELLRVAIGIILVGFCVSQIYNDLIALAVLVPLMVIVVFVLSKKMQNIYQRFEERFYGNLNARETAEYQTLSAHVNRKNTEIQNELKPWEASIISLTVPNMATYIGRKLEELAWREKYGINIVYIKRGEKLIHAPVKTNILLPFVVVGTIVPD